MDSTKICKKYLKSNTAALWPIFFRAFCTILWLILVLKSASSFEFCILVTPVRSVRIRI